MWSEQGRAARGEGRAVCASPGWVAAGWTEQLPPRSADQAGGATAGAVGLADPCRDPGWAIPPSEHGHHRGSEQRTGTADLHLKGCFGRCVKSRRGLGVGGGRGQQREQTGERSRDSASSRARGTQGVQGAWRQPTDRRGWVLYAAGCTPLPTSASSIPHPLGRHQPLFPGRGGAGSRTAS